MKKKLLFMLSSMNIGGVEKALLSLLSFLPKENYDVTVLLLEKTGGFLDEIPKWITIKEASWYKYVKPIIMQPPKQTVYDFYKKREFIKIPTFVASYFYAKKFNDRFSFYKHVLKLVKTDENYYDVAVAFQGPTDIIDFYISNKVKAGKKISWVHFDVTKHHINIKLYTNLYKNFNEIYAVSELAKNSLIKLIPKVNEKVAVVKNLISPGIIENLSKNNVYFDNNYKGVRIVTVGRLSEEKGQDVAIRVLHKLRQDGYDVRWYCVGEGNSRSSYETLIKSFHLEDSFFLLGAISNPYPYIAKADIYVQPSRHEGFCLTLAEAKILNKPIVTSNFLGAYEQLINGYNGLIATSEEEIYKHIKSLLNNPALLSYLKDNLTKDFLETSVDLVGLF